MVPGETHCTSEQVEVLLQVHERDRDGSRALASYRHLHLHQLRAPTPSAERAGIKTHPIGITPPCPDVLLNPFERLDLILQPEVGRSVRSDLIAVPADQLKPEPRLSRLLLARVKLDSPKSEDAQTVLNHDEDHRFLLHPRCQLNPSHVVLGKTYRDAGSGDDARPIVHLRSTRCETASMTVSLVSPVALKTCRRNGTRLHPYHDRQECRLRIGARGREDIEVETVFRVIRARYGVGALQACWRLGDRLDGGVVRRILRRDESELPDGCARVSEDKTRRPRILGSGLSTHAARQMGRRGTSPRVPPDSSVR